MAATLNPTYIKEVMDKSQHLRRLYYHIRISFIMLQSYRMVKMIMAKSYIRNHQAGVDVKKKKKRRRNYTFKKAGLKAEKKCNVGKPNYLLVLLNC